VSHSISQFQVSNLQQLLKETPRDKARETIKIYDIKNNLIDEFDSGENREYVELTKIKKITQQAFVSAEDERFYVNNGFDIRSMLRAMFRNMVSGDSGEGGSTITQQLARNVYLNSFEKTFSRKMKEILLSIEIEKKYDKPKILEFYLNQVYFGCQAYGIEAASKTYFGKNAGKLDLAESAMLAGVLTSPSTINPFSDLERAKLAQVSVLTKMVDNGYIKLWQKEQALDEKLKFAKLTTKKNVSSINYFIDFVKEELNSRVGQSVVLRGGLEVYTTVDPEIQKAGEDAVNIVLDGAERAGDFGKVSVNAYGAKQPQGALAAIDVKTGWIQALVGGRDYKTTQFNRTLSLRPPGSTFKTFVYATAFEEGGYSPYSYVRSSPISIDGWNPTEWFTGYFGTITVQYAIQESSNICAIRALLDVGMENVAKKTKKMAGIGEISFLGDREILAVPSMALGTVEMRPIEMASAGQTIANMGKHMVPTSIYKIVNRKNNSTIFNADLQNNLKDNQVIAETTAYDMITCLKRVVRYGTGKTANVPWIPCAGKTGTTTNFRDGWFMGFTPRISASVYVGADTSDTDLSFVQNYGSKYSAAIWREFIKRVPHKNLSDWVEPRGEWETARVCEETGLLPNSTCTFDTKRFRKGKAPTAICPRQHTEYIDVTICIDTKLIANDACPHKKVAHLKRDEAPKKFCQLHLKKQSTEKPKDTVKKDDKKDTTKKDETPTKTEDNTDKNNNNNSNKNNQSSGTGAKKDNNTKPKPDPEPKPKPDPEPTPQPEEPEPEPEPDPPQAKYFTVFPTRSSCYVNDLVEFTFAHNYPNASRIEMYVNKVFLEASGSEGPISWVPSSSMTYSIVFYLKDENGNILDSRSISFTVY
ncbi:MAG: PBP1A family penicillin-binding protein, partial [Caldiserica bacterium]|nr:PBP1A family penicillin-binding protein [Caldisericota bacterium]